MLDFSTIRTLLFDMDGVLYRGKQRLPGVREVLAFCDQHAITYACITNNATMTPRQYEEKLAAMGIQMSGERVLTSALVTGRYLRSHYPRGTTVYAVGMRGLLEALFDDGYFVPHEDQPDLVVQGADFELTYDKLKAACLAIRAGAHFVATNPDKTFPSELGLVPGAGSIMAALQTATDVEAQVIGKPQPTMFQVALDLLNSKPEETVVIGDRLDTDIAGAQNAHLRSVLLLSGVARPADLEESVYQPDAVFEGLPQFLAAWTDHKSKK